MPQNNTPTGKFIKFAEWWDADLYAKTGIKWYWVTDDTVKLVEKLRWQWKLDPIYPDNYDYTKKQDWKWPWFYETSTFSSDQWDDTAKRLREQYAKYGTWEVVTTWKNWEQITNKITRTPKWAGITPKNPKDQMALRKENIRRWVKKLPTAKMSDWRTPFWWNTVLWSKSIWNISL